MSFNRKIMRFKLTDAQRQTFVVPIRSETLKAGVHENDSYVWMLVDANEKYKEEREFFLFEDETPISYPYLKYIGTVENYKFIVRHVFEKVNP